MKKHLTHDQFTIALLAVVIAMLMAWVIHQNRTIGRIETYLERTTATKTEGNK